MYNCEKCNKSFESKEAYAGHCSSHNRIKKEKIKKEHRCKYCNIQFKSGPSLGSHVRMCKLSPTYEKKYKKRLENNIKGPLLQEHKEKISKGMKQAHKEKRAWNIGQSRWNNKQSYPEIFFTEVIENEFKDKNYKSEYNVGIYSLDFAWVEKKKVIEIDGEQHQRFEEYIKRDKRKDLFLIENGWQILRINWKDMYNDTKFYINKAKEFIHTQ